MRGDCVRAMVGKSGLLFASGAETGDAAVWRVVLVQRRSGRGITARRAEALGTVTRMGRDRTSGLGPPKADRARPKATPVSASQPSG